MSTFLEAIDLMRNGAHVARLVEKCNTAYVVLHIGPKPGAPVGEDYDVILARRNDQTPDEAAPWNAAAGTYIDNYRAVESMPSNNITAMDNGTEPENIINDDRWVVVTLDQDGRAPAGPSGHEQLNALIWAPPGTKVAAGSWAAGQYVWGEFDTEVRIHYFVANTLVLTYVNEYPPEWNCLDGWHTVTP